MLESRRLILSSLGVSKEFPTQKKALVKVDCLFEKGAIHVVYGPNGAGKSVLLRGLAGLDHFTTSTIKRHHDEPLSVSYFHNQMLAPFYSFS